jgi:glycosyltransferase involved in cell wall biosynthesis
MRLSVVIPAFNEERYLTPCLESLQAALAANHSRMTSVEIVVCDNNSADETAEIARQCGARVVFEPHNQISRARNSGAKAATGDWLLFVDADCVVYPETIADMLDHIESGRFVGGGCAVKLDQAPLYGRLIAWMAVTLFKFLKLAGGSFVFCRVDAFRDVGGFSEEVYAGEEVFFSRALKRWGKPRGLKFAFLTRRPIVTSGRKMETHGIGTILWLGLRGMFLPRSTLGSRKHLGFFYDGKR